jgi:hypothetical protein
MISQVQRSPASGVRSFGRVHPRVCFISLKRCSMSNLLRNACQRASTLSLVFSSCFEDFEFHAVDRNNGGLGEIGRIGHRVSLLLSG